MQNYLNIIREIQSRGKTKIARDYKTTGIFDAQWSFDLSPQLISITDLSSGKIESHYESNFPFLTTRKLGPKSMAAELWCFMHGVTSKRVFRETGCGFWDEWANPTRIPTHLQGEARKEAMLLEDDLGPIYGYQWRNFGEPYLPGRSMPIISQGDQFVKVCDMLRNNPDDRRMIVSAWSYCQLPQMALPPCHVLFNLVHYEGVLHLKWHQRSCDMVLGVPYNIACYSLLLILLAKHANLIPGTCSATLCDAHIYDGGSVDHRDGLVEQLSREPRSLPTYTIENNTPQNKKFPFDIFQWKPENFKLTNYDPHPAIKFNIAV